MKQKLLRYIIPITIASFVVGGIIWSASSFPTSKDSLPTVAYNDVITETGWNNIIYAVNAIQDTVGITNSADTASHDYLIRRLTDDWDISGLNALTPTSTRGLIVSASSTFGYINVLGINGNASTSNALLANGANCSVGNYPLGIDASGNVENCTAVSAFDNGSNWQFIGVNALRPTSTIGIIVSASSTINTLDISGGTVTGMNIYPSFSFSTTSWSGTTTIALGPAWVAETWLSAQCFTNAGNISVVFNDGANNMDLIHASTTIGIVNFTANNSFTASEKRYVTMGSPESSAQSLSCTIKKRF